MLAAADRPAPAGRGRGRPTWSPAWAATSSRCCCRRPTPRGARRSPQRSCGVLCRRRSCSRVSRSRSTPASASRCARSTAQDADTLLRCADVAMYAGQARGHGRGACTAPADDDAQPDRLALLGELRTRDRARRAAAALPAQAGPARRHAGRRRGAGALAAPAARVPAAERVHPAGRADRADPSAQPLGARSGAAAARRPGATRASTSRWRSTCRGATLHDPQLPEMVAAAAGALGGRARRAGARDHREQPDGRPGARAART